MKYKVGDKVRVRSDTVNPFFGDHSKARLAGKEVEISCIIEITQEQGSFTYYHIKDGDREDHFGKGDMFELTSIKYFWTEDMFEKEKERFPLRN